MNDSLIRILAFYVLAALTIGGAVWVAFARNIVHSAFALLATFAGVAGLYAFLSADLVAVVQFLVYVGGILILILFAVMLTARIDEARISNPSLGPAAGLAVLVGVTTLIIIIAVTVFGQRTLMAPEGPTSAGVGNALLGPYILPFEVISVLLLAVLIGAVTLASGKMTKPSLKQDREAE
jgi:NAD(P)H-quinone oxidoreductase subunit 6